MAYVQYELDTLDQVVFIREAERRLAPPFDATDTALFRKLLDAGLPHEEAELIATEAHAAECSERLTQIEVAA